MRLLRRSNPGEFSFSRNFVGNDTIPPYAILSHTWGADTSEVTFEDLRNGTGKDKPGYEKIRFCGDQAGQDDLEYFWVDTCCINKADFTELSEAINSMFRLYRGAVKCYAYLSDVSSSKRKKGDQNSQKTWESAFRGSRWFTRGWTLQELLAPVSVEFFSKDGKRLGDRKSLEKQINETTRVPISALQGRPLSEFSIDERMSWMAKRETKREEDKAYSLLGILDIYMPLIYGEGEENAFLRLHRKISKASIGEHPPRLLASAVQR